MQRQVQRGKRCAGVGFEALEGGELAQGRPVVDEVREALSGVGGVESACTSPSRPVGLDEGVA